MSTGGVGKQEVNKLVPDASLEDIGSDFWADRRDVPQSSPSRRPVGIQEEIKAGQDLQPFGEDHGHTIADMLKALSVELKGGFETSNVNQAKIRSLCEDLGKKIDELAGQTAVLQEEVGELRMLGKYVIRVTINTLCNVETITHVEKLEE
ncbi:hypothetical protein NDU88_005105 [Pleurodeles waltl]|uniref:Uncharacterized protein n=1 Tax=Pleurodeles waltl TaxID=8319 RepID=A0AAV7VIZ7_PLEWA|nr:hypothetical protein NDU88_005105 [Pleurodeles waltl]